MEKLILPAFVAVVLTGCASMADSMSHFAGLGIVSEDTSDFDGSTTVQVTPAFLAHSEGGTISSKLGARWNSNTPEHVALLLKYSSDASSGSSYLNFHGIDINIDGDISEYKTNGPTRHDRSSYNSVTRTIYTESTSVVVVPMAMLRKMLTASDVRLRIHTSEGHEEARFSVERIPGGQGTAIIPIREFSARVQAKVDTGGKT